MHISRAGRVTAAVSAGLFAVLVGVPAAASPTGGGKTVIDTLSGWDGTSSLSPWGTPDTATYGQVVTIPEGDGIACGDPPCLKRVMKHEKYDISAHAGTGTMTFRAEIYGWDGTKATTKVFESKPMTLQLTEGDASYKAVTINSKHAKVMAGQQYVTFLSVSKDYEANPPNLEAQWACNYSDVYAGGSAVYLNDGGDESQWTTQAWSSISTFDMATVITLK